MTEDLSAQIKNYALYLPAVPTPFMEYVVTKRDPKAPRIARPIDLNFLNSHSKLWTYKYCLASAGHLAYSKKSNAITQRDPKSSWILGDSGGYQVGTGALPEMKKWSANVRKTAEISRLWQKAKTKINYDILRWLDANCDYAMTLDMPLWVKGDQFKETPFHNFSVKQLTDLTVDNLKYIDKHRGLVGNCKFLNVLQGNTEAEESFWYRQVRDFEFEGWALGGMVSWKGGLPRVLKRLLLLRDDGMLGGRRKWLHLLGCSQLIWSVALTAAQRSIQVNTSSEFTISFDTSTPFLWAGKFQQYPKPPQLTKDIRTWRFSNLKFPVGYAAATTNAKKPFPVGSSLSDLLTLGDMNPNKSKYAAQTFGTFSAHALANHNVYVYLRAIIDANKKVFTDKVAPQAIADMIGLIDELFSCEKWNSLLKRKEAKLETALQKSGSDADLDEEVAY
jgi:hypothetical protein